MHVYDVYNYRSINKSVALNQSWTCTQATLKAQQTIKFDLPCTHQTHPGI